MLTGCIACQRKGPGMIDIYDHPNGLDEMFTSVTGVEIQSEDHLCILCYDDLKSAHNFKQKCIQNNLLRVNALNSAAKQQTTTSNYTVDPKAETEEEISTTTKLDNAIEDEKVDDNLSESQEITTNSYALTDLEEIGEYEEKLSENETDASPEIIVLLHDNEDKMGLKCHICGKEYSKTAHLSKHMETHEVTATTYETLDVEDEQILDKDDDEDEMKAAHDLWKKPHDLMCEFCFIEFDSFDVKQTHELEHQSEARPYKCYFENCQAVFKDKVGLRNHIRIHSDFKRHKCRYCEMRFHQRGNQLSHERLHTGEKPFVCTHCGKAFAESGNLKNHIRFHTGERPYPCPNCPKRFKTHYSHKVHIRTHTNERPYLCSDCGKSFFSSGKLLVHKRIHTGEKPYQCTQCVAKFVDSSGLKRHSKIH